MRLIDADAPTNTKTKKCWGCEYFRIIQEPLRCGKDIWDLGRAECNNYDLVVDFINHGKLKKLVCIELENEMNVICGDNRFEIIAKAKKHLLDATNIETSPDEMKVLDTFLFRCWQMGWLDRYESKENE